jgi:hypothetical protein
VLLIEKTLSFHYLLDMAQDFSGPAAGVETLHGRDHDHALASTEEASHRLSTLAAWAVSACAVHCVITPFAGILPLVGMGVFSSPWFEWTMVAIAAGVGGAGLGLSYSRVHGGPSPGIVFLGGIALLVATHLFLEGAEVLHALAAVAGAGVILVAGAMNHSLVHACERCHPHPHGLARPARSR